MHYSYLKITSSALTKLLFKDLVWKLEYLGPADTPKRGKTAILLYLFIPSRFGGI